TLRSTKEEEQEDTLKGIIDAKEAIPHFSPPEGMPKDAKVKFELAGPEEMKRFRFYGNETADARKWTAMYKDRVGVEIVSPSKGARSPEYSYPTVTDAAEAASYVPKQVRSLITQIVINVSLKPNSPKAIMSA